MSFFQIWTSAKKTFEAKTKEKKPSEKFMGLFRKSSGLETATKALDTVLKKKDFEGMQQAGTEFKQVAQTYASLLQKTNVTDKGTEYKAQLVALEKALDDIADDYDKECEALRTNEFKLLEKKLALYEKLVRGGLNQVLNSVDEAEERYQACDLQLRALTTAVVQKQMPLAKKAGTAMNGEVKALAILEALLEKSCKGWETKIAKDLGAFKKSNLYLVKRNNDKFEYHKSQIDSLPMAMKLRVERVTELLGEAKGLLKTALQALSKGVDAGKIFANSIAKFGERARTLATKWGNEAAAFGGAMEGPENELEAILKETQPNSQERIERMAGVRENLTEQLQEIPITRKGIEAAHSTLTKEWKSFPSDVRENKDYAEDAKEVQISFETLAAGLKALEKAEGKINKLLVKAK